ncbi:hypothetical protein Droror1_Dr00025891 [Drosera rotundifolia]
MSLFTLSKAGQCIFPVLSCTRMPEQNAELSYSRHDLVLQKNIQLPPSKSYDRIHTLRRLFDPLIKPLSARFLHAVTNRNQTSQTLNNSQPSYITLSVKELQLISSVRVFDIVDILFIIVRMMSRGATRGARVMIRAVGPRYFWMGPTGTSGVVAAAEEAATAGGRKLIIGAPGYERKMVFGFVSGGGDARSLAGLVRFNTGMRARKASTVALNNEEEREEEKVGKEEEAATEKVVASYWGVQPRKVTKGDGTQWRWTCFRPWETYKSDTRIDLTKHHVPATLMDKMAYWTVKALRWPTDIFFQRRYGCRAMMLETVAAVPGMVGGMLLHCKSLRKFEHSGGWIKALLEEAENERMHLMTFMEVSQPRWYERALVFAVQGVFFNAYFLAYIISPKLAHRIVGYLEEEAIHSYTEFLKELDKGNIENVPAPAIAMDYWQLPAGSTLRDVVMVVRADEAHHRDVNHFASDIHYQGRELREAPAPIGYH